jgi:hypothetical protein
MKTTSQHKTLKSHSTLKSAVVINMSACTLVNALIGEGGHSSEHSIHEDHDAEDNDNFSVGCLGSNHFVVNVSGQH